MKKLRLHKILNLFLFLTLFVLCTMPSFAGNLILKYEQVYYDNNGNEIFCRTVNINDINNLPKGSQWREYLDTKLQNGQTIYEYASQISNSLNRDFVLTISDRDSNSYAYKDTKNDTYNLNIFKYINEFEDSSYKTGLFMHEFGHVVMLNTYPRSYDFSNLNYGDDNVHYLTEILPDHNTSWVEGWANAFAAANNNGKIFSYDFKEASSISFLNGYSFDEMCRNELFVGKVLYDSFKDIPGGQAASYDVFTKSSPCSSLYQFCQKYVELYPQNKVALAKILVENSFGNITLKELLAYVNGGSNKVTQELYQYLESAGMLNGTASNNYTQNNTNTTNQKPSLWSRIVGFFKKLFGGKNTDVAASPSKTTVSTGRTDGNVYDRYTDGTLSIRSSLNAPTIAPSNAAIGAVISPENTNKQSNSNSIEEVQAEYMRYYNEYTELVKAANPDRTRLLNVRNKMISAKKKLDELKK